MQQDNESRKLAVQTMIERIKAYPDKKMEVKFRVGEKFEGTHGEQDSDPTAVQTPATAVYSYLQTWQYVSARS